MHNYTLRVRKILLKIMALLAKVSMQTSTQRFSRPIAVPRTKLSFFVYRGGLCKNCSIDLHGCNLCNVTHEFIWTELLYSVCKFGQVFLMHTVHTIHV